MPGGAGTRFKGDISRGNTDVVVSVEQRINPDTTDKILRRAIHCSVAYGMQDSQLDTIQQRLQQASDARAQEVAGGEVLYSGDANLTDEQIAKLPFALYRQGYEYYWKTHAHPNSTFKYTTSSLLDLMNSEITTY